MSAASIRVRIPSGALRSFNAAEVNITDGFVTVTGRWADAPRTAGTYTWPGSQVVQIRYEAVHDAA